MEKWMYWFKRIIKKKWKDCRSLCAACEYYDDCKSDCEDFTDKAK